MTAIADATRIAFNQVIRSTSKESIYGFCLYTVDDLAGIVPSASAEPGFTERKEKVLANRERLAWLKQVNIVSIGSYSATTAGVLTHGSSKPRAETLFADANRMLADFVAKAKERKSSFTQLTAEVLASFTIALHRLRLRVCSTVK